MKNLKLRLSMFLAFAMLVSMSLSLSHQALGQDNETCGTCVQNRWEKMGSCFILVGSFEDDEGTVAFASGDKRKCAPLDNSSCRTNWQTGCFKDASQMPAIDP